MPFSFDEDVKNLWLLLVDCGVVFGAAIFAFPSLQEQFFWYEVYEGKTEEGIITGNNCIHTLLLFLFSPLWDETLCNFTSRQVFLDNSWSRSLAWPKNSRIPDSQISVSGKVS